MNARISAPFGLVACWGFALAAGCTSSDRLAQGPFPAGIRRPLAPPVLLPPPKTSAELPAVPREDAPKERSGKKPMPEAPGGKEKAGPPEGVTTLPYPRIQATASRLELAEVLAVVDRSFPLLLAADQERAIAAGKRLAAEGGFDLNLRSRGNINGGTFPNERLDLMAEQATPLFGASFYGGYRLGRGDFPVYYGDRLTAEDGELRAGLVVPFLRDAPIDKRRALLRQAQLGEPLADALIRRARIDFFRAGAHAYWDWVAAGERYLIADKLLALARERQAGLEDQFKKGQIAEFVVIDNRRLIVEREGLLVAGERSFQKAALQLSLYLRDEQGNPVVPAAGRLPRNALREELTPPDTAHLPEHVATALALRPELVRFQVLKEQVAVDQQLARNQALPALNASVGASQDMGTGKKGEGIFELNRSVLEASVLLEVPLQRRDARGRTQAAQARMMQLLSEERFTRDRITVDVQDAVSNLDRTFARLKLARNEQQIAQQVAELERERFGKGQGTLLEVNLRELAAAGAQSKVIDTAAEYYRATADYRAALGLDAIPTAP